MFSSTHPIFHVNCNTLGRIFKYIFMELIKWVTIYISLSCPCFQTALIILVVLINKNTRKMHVPSDKQLNVAYVCHKFSKNIVAQILEGEGFPIWPTNYLAHELLQQ